MTSRLHPRRRHSLRKRGVYKRSRCGTVPFMESIADSVILVPARALDDLAELASRLADRADPNDALVMALRGAIGQVRSGSVIEH